LLYNLGWLNWSVVSRIAAYWPLLLILLGAQLLIQGRVSRRLATISAAVLVILVLLAIMAGIASIPGATGAAGSSRTTSYSGSLASLSSARLNLSVGSTQLAVDSADLGEDLYRASITLPEGDRPTVTKGENGTVNVQTPNRSGFQWPFYGSQSRVQVTLSNHLPWSIDANAGASNGDLDLSGLRLGALSLESGASDLQVRLPTPAGTLPVQVSGGALHLVLTRPAGVETRVSLNGGASNLTVDGNHFNGFAREGQAFVSPGYATATDRVDIGISSGASDVTVRS